MSSEDRIQRILRRQAEREAAMRERDARARQAEAEAKQARLLNVTNVDTTVVSTVRDAELAEKERQYAEAQRARMERAQAERDEEQRRLQMMQQKWKMEDAHVRGYVCQGIYSTALQPRSSNDVAVMHDEEEARRDTTGGSVGQEWVRTDMGWTRTVERVGKSYATATTAHTISTAAYRSLHVAFGLRRSHSQDFVDGCRFLSHMFDAYYNTEVGSRSIQKLLMEDLSVAVKTFQRSPQAMPTVLALLTQAKTAIERVQHSRSRAAQSFANDSTWLAQVTAWLDNVHMVSQSTQEMDDWSAFTMSPFQLLSKNVVIIIFSYLGPNDVACVSQVCALWYALSNADMLYRLLLRREGVQMTDDMVSEGMSAKAVYQNHTLRKRLPRVGFFVCTLCGRCYWAAYGNRRSECPGTGGGGQSQRYYGRHTGNRILPKTFLSTLISLKPPKQ